MNVFCALILQDGTESLRQKNSTGMNPHHGQAFRTLISLEYLQGNPL
jgi:hypothetical protein